MINILIISFLISFFSMFVIIKYTTNFFEFYGINRPQRFHKGSVSRLGGIGMALCLIFIYIYINFFDNQQYKLPVSIIFCISLAVFVGVLEDVTQKIPVRARLLVTHLSAIGICYFLNVSVLRLDIIFLDECIKIFPLLGFLIAVVAIGGLPHAFNIIDGYNGLAGVVALVISAALAYVAYMQQDFQIVIFLMVLIGVTLGFIIWNYPYGKIFAGDAGAYFWGLCIALVCVVLVARYENLSPWFPILLLSYPLSETFFSIYRKKIRGESPGKADSLHLHQLIFRRWVKAYEEDRDISVRLLEKNYKTSPYLWLANLLAVIPALVFRECSLVLMFLGVMYFFAYVYIYISIVRFRFKF